MRLFHQRTTEVRTITNEQAPTRSGNPSESRRDSSSTAFRLLCDKPDPFYGVRPSMATPGCQDVIHAQSSRRTTDIEIECQCVQRTAEREDEKMFRSLFDSITPP